MNSTREELLFTEGLISALRCLRVKQIPFSNLYFRDGIAKLKEFIMASQIDHETIADLEPLFVQTPFEGDYDRIEKALEYFNGSDLSFAMLNPLWETATIETPYSLAEDTLNSKRSGLPKNFMIQAAKEFCSGAGINF